MLTEKPHCAEIQSPPAGAGVPPHTGPGRAAWAPPPPPDALASVIYCLRLQPRPVSGFELWHSLQFECWVTCSCRLVCKEAGQGCGQDHGTAAGSLRRHRGAWESPQTLQTGLLTTNGGPLPGSFYSDSGHTSNQVFFFPTRPLSPHCPATHTFLSLVNPQNRT